MGGLFVCTLATVCHVLECGRAENSCGADKNFKRGVVRYVSLWADERQIQRNQSGSNSFLQRAVTGFGDRSGRFSGERATKPHRIRA